MNSYVILCLALNVFLVFGDSTEITDANIGETVALLKKTGCSKTATDDQFKEFAQCIKEHNKYASANQYAGCKSHFEDAVKDKPVLEAVCQTFGGPKTTDLVKCIYQERQKDYPGVDVIQGTIEALKKCHVK